MESDDLPSVFAVLREYLIVEHRRGMSYKSLGKLAGLNPPEVSRIVHAGAITPARLRAAAAALGLSSVPPAAPDAPTTQQGAVQP